MCSITIGLMAASAVMSAYGSYSQGQAQAAAAEAQAQQADYNAKIAEQQAQDAEHRGRIAEQNQRMKTAQVLGQQRAGFGASGFDLSGTALDILGDTAMVGEMDALTVRHNAEYEAWDRRQQAYGFQNEAAVARASGKNAKKAGMINAGTSLLGSAATIYGKLPEAKPSGGGSITMTNKYWTPKAAKATGPSYSPKFFG